MQNLVIEKMGLKPRRSTTDFLEPRCIFSELQVAHPQLLAYSVLSAE
ncbi:MAG: hypothetical protein V7K70_25345 [Nostoc sp.]